MRSKIKLDTFGIKVYKHKEQIFYKKDIQMLEYAVATFLFLATVLAISLIQAEKNIKNKEK
jgi:hypothetical protein